MKIVIKTNRGAVRIGKKIYNQSQVQYFYKV